MSRYDTAGGLQSEVRLRSWPAGQASQMRLVVSRLESILNDTLGASVEQSAKRTFSAQVPFVQNLRAIPGFKQFEIRFDAPPELGGHPLRNLLFYEIQHAEDGGFANPTVLQTAQTNILVGGLGLGETRFVRVRVVNTRNEVGPWINTNTTSAQGRIIVTNMFGDSIDAGLNVRICTPPGHFQPVFNFEYTTAGGSVTLNTHLAMATPAHDVTKKDINDIIRKNFRGGPAMLQWRWVVAPFNDFTGLFEPREQGQRGMISARPGYSTSDGDKTPMAFGTSMTNFFTPEAGILQRFTLQVAKCPGTEWEGPEHDRELLDSDPILFVRNARVLEVLTEF